MTAMLPQRSCVLQWHATWTSQPKIVQERLGHSTLAMTMDTYGHLFPVTHDAEQFDNAALRIINPAS
jgi:integrase